MTTYSSPAVANKAPVPYHGSRNAVQVMRQTVTCTAAPSTADTLQFFYMPKNARIVGIYLAASDMDTNGSPALALNIGDAGSANRLFAASTVGQAGTVSGGVSSAGLDYLYPAKTLVTGTASTNAATGAAGTVTLCIHFVIEDPVTT